MDGQSKPNLRRGVAPVKTSQRKNSLGLSLIELMIAIVIGIILTLGLVQIFGAAREAYRLSEGLARVQENGRFAMDYLQRDIRMAGHFGCVNDQARLQTTDALVSQFATGGPLDFTTSIRGFDGAPAGITLTPAPIAGTDSIVLRFLTANGVPVSVINAAAGTLSVDAAKWDVLTQDGVANPVLFGVADCAYANVFAASAVSSGSVTVPGSVNLMRYGTSPEGGPAVLYRAEAVVYYIGLGAGGRPSLWRARLNAAGTPVSEELVEGVENMQFRYGLDQSADPTRPTGYIATQGTATDIGAAAGDWRRVGQVQVGMLVASPDLASSLQAAIPRTVLGVAPVIPDDRRYRSTYEATIALRNRLYGN